MQNDFIKAVGEVSVTVYDNNKPVARFEEKNLVVTLGKTNIAKLLGGDAAGHAITKIGVGTGSVAPTVGDSSLTAAFTKLLDSVSYPDANSVLFHFDIGNADANGLNIVEFGLFNDADILFARKVRSEIITKTSAIRLVGTWKITIN